MASNRTVGVEITMGSLRQIIVTENIHICKEPKCLENFRAEIETVAVWEHYGQYNEDRIHLLQNSEEKPIKIGTWEFYPVMKDVHYWQRSNQSSDNHKVTINGRDGDGRIFEETITIPGDDLLPGIIYSLILYSIVNDVDKAKDYWEALTGHHNLRLWSTSKLLDTVLCLRTVSKRIIKEHPYTELFFQQGLHTAITKLKESIDKLDNL